MNTVAENVSPADQAELREILFTHLRSLCPRYWPGGDGLTLDVVIESYCRAAADGRVPGKDELCCRHASMAHVIEVFFAGSESLDGPAGPPTASPLYDERTD